MKAKAKKVAPKAKKRTAANPKTRTASKPKKGAKKLAKKRVVGSQPMFVGALELPKGFDPRKATPEQMQKLVTTAVKGLYRQGVLECADAIMQVVVDFPLPIALEALEMILLASMGHLGDVEQKALAAHLAQFHAELTLMSTPEPTATVQ